MTQLILIIKNRAMLFWMRLRDWVCFSYVSLNTNRSHFGEIIVSLLVKKRLTIYGNIMCLISFMFFFKFPIYTRLFLYLEFKRQNVIPIPYPHTHTHTHTHNSFEVLDKDSFYNFNAN